MLDWLITPGLLQTWCWLVVRSKAVKTLMVVVLMVIVVAVAVNRESGKKLN